ncbi:MAG: 7TM domain-containing protein [Candidatus Eisenbacteria bacterium]
MSDSPAAARRSSPGFGTRIRERRSLTRVELVILTALAVLPLLSIALRFLALPGVDSRLEGAVRIGDFLNQVLSLSDVPVYQRQHVIYLLLIPTSALIVTLARLTLGLKVLAFRSILISVAFHQSGLLASFLLIGLAVVAIQILRPWLRDIELPRYARLSVILCMMSTMMVGAILLGPWMPADIAVGMLAFPVIALAFLAEGLARTSDRDHFIRACWIAANTIAIALVMAFVYWIPTVRSFVLRFPEIVLTQGVAVVMVAKFLDLRLFEHWDDGLMRTLRSRSWLGARKRVAVIRNRVEPGTSSRHTLRSVQKIVDALREARYQVKVMEGDTHLPRELRRFFPENPATGDRDGVVLNLAQGGRGDAGTTHIPAILEMHGVAYSGPTPLGHAMTFDRVAFKVLLREAGIPTPVFHLIPTRRPEVPDLTYPAAVVPRHELDTKAAIVSDVTALRRAVRKLRRAGVEEAFVEQHVAGRSIAASLLGNDPVECLPLVELNAEGERICPAPLDEAIAERIREQARAAFRACGCRDYGRVGIRIGEAGELWVTEVRTLGILAAQGAFARAGAEAGHSFPALMARIVEVTRKRSRTRNLDRASTGRGSRTLVQPVGSP